MISEEQLEELHTYIDDLLSRALEGSAFRRVLLFAHNTLVRTREAEFDGHLPAEPLSKELYEAEVGCPELLCYADLTRQVMAIWRHYVRGCPPEGAREAAMSKRAIAVGMQDPFATPVLVSVEYLCNVPGNAGLLNGKPVLLRLVELPGTSCPRQVMGLFYSLNVVTDAGVRTGTHVERAIESLITEPMFGDLLQNPSHLLGFLHYWRQKVYEPMPPGVEPPPFHMADVPSGMRN